MQQKELHFQNTDDHSKLDLQCPILVIPSLRLHFKYLIWIYNMTEDSLHLKYFFFFFPPLHLNCFETLAPVCSKETKE